MADKMAELRGAAEKFIQLINPNKMKYIKKMSKKNLGVIFQAITGHGLFGHHISKWKKRHRSNMSMLSGRGNGDSVALME